MLPRVPIRKILLSQAKFIPRQWQEWQLLDEQPLQPPPPDPILELAEPLSPPLLKPKTDIFRQTSVESHLGQFTDSSLLKTSLSNSSLHLQHWYSKMGIFSSDTLLSARMHDGSPLFHRKAGHRLPLSKHSRHLNQQAEF
jgi:hypothetical protein